MPGVYCLFLLLFLSLITPAQKLPEKDYLVYVLSESADKITLVRFGPKGAKVERALDTGSMPTDMFRFLCRGHPAD